MFIVAMRLARLVYARYLYAFKHIGVVTYAISMLFDSTPLWATCMQLCLDSW